MCADAGDGVAATTEIAASATITVAPARPRNARPCTVARYRRTATLQHSPPLVPEPTLGAEPDRLASDERRTLPIE